MQPEARGSIIADGREAPLCSEAPTAETPHPMPRRGLPQAVRAEDSEGQRINLGSLRPLQGYLILRIPLNFNQPHTFCQSQDSVHYHTEGEF